MSRQGELLAGQLLDLQEGITTPYTQQIQNVGQGGRSPNLGNPNAEVTVVDANATEDKIFDFDTAKEQYLDLFYGPVFTTIDNIRFPDELRGITVIFTRSSGNGSDASGGGGSGSGPLSLSNSARATSSAGIVADVQPNIRPHFLDNVDADLYYFYAESANATKAEVLARLSTEIGTTVNPWPVFFPDPISIAVFGENISLAANGSAQQTLNSDGGLTYSTGAGKSIEVQPNVRSLDLSATLHRTIAITSKSDSVDISVSASAGWTGFGSFPTRTGGATVPPQTVNASVSPTMISATSPANIPTTGLYLYNIRPQKALQGLFLYVATVIDAANFQSPIIDFNYNGGAITLPDGTAVSIGPDFHGGFPDSFALQSGSFTGTGLTLNTSTGIISGTTLGATVSVVTIRATNAKGFSDAVLTITVAT